MKVTEVFAREQIEQIMGKPLIHDGHHVLGSSSMYRAAMCPGSVLMTLANIEVPTDTADSMEGTRNHAEISDTIKAALLEGIEPTNEHARSAYLAVKAVVEMMEGAGWTIDGIHSEQPLEPKCTLGRGTLDLLIVANKGGKKLYYDIDFKTGMGAEAGPMVEWQLKDHARLCFDAGADIVYANAYATQHGEWLYADSFKWRKADEDDEEIHMEIGHVTHDALDVDNAELRPDPVACRYCRGALSGNCPAWRDWNKCGFEVIVPHEDVSIFAAIELVKRGHMSDEMKKKMDEGKALLDRAQAYVDGIKREIDDAIKTLGGTDGYQIQNVKEQRRIKYKDCWAFVRDNIPNATEIEAERVTVIAAQERVVPRRNKSSAAVNTEVPHPATPSVIAVEQATKQEAASPLSKVVVDQMEVPPSPPPQQDAASTPSPKKRRGRPPKNKSIVDKGATEINPSTPTQKVNTAGSVPTPLVPTATVAPNSGRIGDAVLDLHDRQRVNIYDALLAGSTFETEVDFKMAVGLFESQCGVPFMRWQTPHIDAFVEMHKIQRQGGDR